MQNNILCLKTFLYSIFTLCLFTVISDIDFVLNYILVWYCLNCVEKYPRCNWYAEIQIYIFLIIRFEKAQGMSTPIKTNQ